MSGSARIWLACAVLASAVGLPNRAAAQDGDAARGKPAAQSYILWYDPIPATSRAASFRSLSDRVGKLRSLPVDSVELGRPQDIGRLGVVAVKTDKSAQELRDAIAASNRDAGRAGEPLPDIIQDESLSTFDQAGCEVKVGAMPSAPTTPYGICRVGGPRIVPEDTTVWIVDSGVDTDYAGKYLNIDRARAGNCFDDKDCTIGPSAAIEDDVGHGTMLAGIIGARADGEGGLMGVAPGVTIVPLKVSDNQSGLRLVPAIRALIHIANQYPSGVPAGQRAIVNLSWGFDWVSAARRRNVLAVGMLNSLVHALADRGVDVVVAAGNAPLGSAAGQWTQFLSPANAGGYRSAGGVFTVSSVGRDDRFSSFSYFGASPVDFAEPGVKVTSLWPGHVTRTCSGTSFSAAHLSGVLAATAKAHQPESGGLSGGAAPLETNPIGVVAPPAAPCGAY